MSLISAIKEAWHLATRPDTPGERAANFIAEMHILAKQAGVPYRNPEVIVLENGSTIYAAFGDSKLRGTNVC